MSEPELLTRSMHPYHMPEYAEALTGAGNYCHLDILESPIWLRTISGTGRHDAIGMYPFSPMVKQATYRQISTALHDLELVSLVLVTDVLETKADWLKDAFQIVRPYKEHYIISHEDIAVRFSEHHRREIRKAKGVCKTRVIPLGDYIDEWCELYSALVSRHALSGFHCFSRTYFEMLARIPQFVSVAAFVGNRMVSAHIWLNFGGHVYSHLGASSKEGYAAGASYAVYDYSISHFTDCRYIDLGGTSDKGLSSAGLSNFKRGFSNQTRTNFICGTIADQECYNTLCQMAGITHSNISYFPAYRTLGSPFANT